jgi:hypothetical protein
VSRSEEQGSWTDVGAAARAGPGQDWRHVLNQEQSGTDESDREATQPQGHNIVLIVWVYMYYHASLIAIVPRDR